MGTSNAPDPHQGAGRCLPLHPPQQTKAQEEASQIAGTRFFEGRVMLRLMPGPDLDSLDGTHKPIGRTQVMPLQCQEAATVKAHSIVTSPGSASLLLSSFLGRRFTWTPACDHGCLALFGSLILHTRRLSSKSVAPVQTSYSTCR